MPRPTLTTLATLAALIALSTSPAVAQTVVFHADFNADTPGEPPNLNPPGDPAGDYITISTRGGIVTVMESFGLMTDQPVVLDRRSSGSLNLIPYVDPAWTGCNTYRLTWTTMITEATDNVSMGVYSEGSLMGAIYYETGGGLEYNLTPLSATYTANVPQTYELTVDIPARTTSLKVDGFADPAAQDRAFVLLNVTNTFARLFITLGGFDYEELAVDDIEFVALDCSVPVEESSWSALKSRFH